MSQTAPKTHLAAAGSTQCAMSGCGVLFKRSRRWQTFCSNKCRNDFHAREARIEAIRGRGPAMFEALRAIAAGPCWEPPYDHGGVAPCPHCAAAEAIKDLKAP